MQTRFVRRAWPLMLLALHAASAGATLDSYSNTVLVSGQQSLRVLELPFESRGGYWVDTKDLEWFDTPLTDLSFGVFTATDMLASKQGAGTLEFYKAGSEKVFLQIFAKPAGPHFAGLVGVRAGSVVPLPPSAGLLVSGFAAVLVLLRRRRKEPAPSASLSAA